MSNIKLQVGEDYLNGLFEKKHIQSYNNVTRLFKDSEEITYLEEGYLAVYVEEHDASMVSTDNQYNLVTHVPKYTPKEPTKDEIEEASSNWYGQISIYPSVTTTWKAAIEWYKQQTK